MTVDELVNKWGKTDAEAVFGFLAGCRLDDVECILAESRGEPGGDSWMALGYLKDFSAFWVEGFFTERSEDGTYACEDGNCLLGETPDALVHPLNLPQDVRDRLRPDLERRGMKLFDRVEDVPPELGAQARRVYPLPRWVAEEESARRTMERRLLDEGRATARLLDNSRLAQLKEFREALRGLTGATVGLLASNGPEERRRAAYWAEEGNRLLKLRINGLGESCDAP